MKHKVPEEIIQPMMARGRIRKYRPYDYDGADWVSRDYALVVPCEMAKCPINRDGHCGMPSSIKIGADGHCKTGKDLVSNSPVQPKLNVCKWCGGLIERHPPNNPDGWRHIGENLSHMAEPR